MDRWARIDGEHRSFTLDEGPRKRALRWIKVEGAFAAGPWAGAGHWGVGRR